MKQEIFRMERVTFQEHEVILLDDFNLQIFQGEIVGMLCVNSHGMLAFLKLLQNNLPLRDGYVYCGGRLVNSWRESMKNDNRISIIGTEKRLVENLRVYDNVFVLRQGFHQEVIRSRLLRKQLTPFFEEIGIDIPVNARVEELSVFERIVVELLRAVIMGNRLIVLHELGNLLNNEEKGRLFDIVRHYAQNGVSFLDICVHFEEMLGPCDRMTLFSNGRIQKIVQKEEMGDNRLERYVEEYTHLNHSRINRSKEINNMQRELLRMTGIAGTYLQNYSLHVLQNECLAVQIRSNAMLKELNHVFCGDRNVHRGELWIKDKKEQIFQNPQIAVIREQTTKSMIFPELDYMDNLCIAVEKRLSAVERIWRIRNSIRREYGSILGKEVFDMPVEELSEKQKLQLVYTRVLLQKPKVVFCLQPFKGADRIHRMFIRDMLEMLLDRGISVVIFSPNLADSLALADRLLIMDEDEVKEVEKQDFIFGWILLLSRG